MKSDLKVIIVEDNEDDLELLLRQIRRSGIHPQYRWVKTSEEMEAALDAGGWDIILTDYALPGFSGQAALEIFRRRELDIPFIIVSGTIGEETAVEMMRAGANDYLMKDNLTRLAPVIEREVREAAVRRGRKQEAKIQETVYRISRAANEAVDLIIFFRTIHPILCEVMPAQNFYIALYDANTDMLSYPYFVDQFDPPPPPRKLDRGMTGYLIRVGKPLLVTPEVFDSLVAQGEVEQEGAPSLDWIGVPLSDSEHVIGAMVAQTYEESVRFTQREVEILDFLADQVELVIQRKQAETDLRKLNRFLQTVSECNKALVRATDEDELLFDLCRVIVEHGGYRLAWIGFVCQGCEDTIRPVTFFANEPFTLDHLPGMMQTGDWTNPAWKAAQSGELQIVHEMPDASSGAAWPADILAHGFQSMIALPLRSGSAVHGVLLIFGSEPNTFNQEETGLLSELSFDLAYGIQTLRTRKERETALEALRESENKFSKFMEFLPIDVYIQDEDRRIAYVNRQFQLSFPGDDWIGKKLLALEPWIHLDEWAADDMQALSGEAVQRIVQMALPDGTHYFETVKFKIPRENGGDWLGGIAWDVSPLIQSEEQIRRSNEELSQAYISTLEGWALALELRDRETAGHSHHVVQDTARLARAMGFTEEALVHVTRGALLHDIGKMGIPDAILLKPGPLTSEDWVIMRQHPQYAYNLLSRIPYLAPALDIPYCHHEHWDGSGYPNGLIGEQIPLAARIFAIVDVYHALKVDRPYRPAWPETEIFDYVRGLAGKQFDPNVVRVFLETITSNKG